MTIEEEQQYEANQAHEEYEQRRQWEERQREEWEAEQRRQWEEWEEWEAEQSAREDMNYELIEEKFF
jgi:hypothetical protein